MHRIVRVVTTIPGRTSLLCYRSTNSAAVRRVAVRNITLQGFWERRAFSEGVVKMAANDKYTDPQLREEVKEEIKEGDKGGKPGQWSARKVCRPWYFERR